MKDIRTKAITVATLVSCLTSFSTALAQNDDFLDLNSGSANTSVTTDEAKAESKSQKRIRQNPSYLLTTPLAGKIQVELSYGKAQITKKSSETISSSVINTEKKTDADLAKTALLYGINDSFSAGIEIGYLQGTQNEEQSSVSILGNESNSTSEQQAKGMTDPVLVGNYRLDLSKMTIQLGLGANLFAGHQELNYNTETQSSEANAASGGNSVSAALSAFSNSMSKGMIGGLVMIQNQSDRSGTVTQEYGSGLKNNYDIKETGGNKMQASGFGEYFSSSSLRLGSMLSYIKTDESVLEGNGSRLTTPETEFWKATGFLNVRLVKGVNLVPSLSYQDILNKSSISNLDQYNAMSAELTARMTF